MKSTIYNIIKQYFPDARIDFPVDNTNIDIFIPILNFGIIMDRSENFKIEKIQILLISEINNKLQSDYQQLYYEENDVELLWNSLALYLVYNFDTILWENKIILP